MKILIVLGYVLKDSKIDNVLKERLDKAIELSNRYQKIIVCGGTVENGSNVSEADAMEKYLIDNGVSKDLIIKENKSTTTIENAIESLKLINNLKLKHNNINIDYISILSSKFHIKRVKYIFSHYFKNLYRVNFHQSKDGLSVKILDEVYRNEIIYLNELKNIF